MLSQAPAKIHWHRQSNQLELVYNEQSYYLTAEFLRVHSTSAEVKGHGPDQTVLVSGKMAVKMTAIESVGHYGIKIIYDDGHDTGIYTWSYLQALANHREQYWLEYLKKLKQENKSRDPHTNVLYFPGA